MRANGIYTGFCYQRIKRFTYDNKLALHALNAVFEPDVKKWIRLDARGNNYQFQADFSINERNLGYEIRPELGEFEFDDLIAVPLPSTMAQMRSKCTITICRTTTINIIFYKIIGPADRQFFLIILKTVLLARSMIFYVCLK